MYFAWPIRSDDRVVYVNDGYSQATIGPNNRDIVWTNGAHIGTL